MKHLLFTALALSAGCQRLLCKDTLEREIPSLDGRFVAGVFERNCGATTGFVTFVEIRARDEAFSRDMDDAVSVIHTDEAPKVHWQADALMVELSEELFARTSRMRTSWRDAKVGYLYPALNRAKDQ